VARPERFELPTLWFEARCSIQLSYGREALNLHEVGRHDPEILGSRPAALISPRLALGSGAALQDLPGTAHAVNCRREFVRFGRLC
jgi:hypothetical protein